MMIKQPAAILAAVGLTLAWGALAAEAAVTYKEDLRDCKLPHAQTVIPLAGMAEPGKGDLLKLVDGSFAVLPGTGGEKPLKRTDLAEALRAKNTGDLEFLPDDSGTFWAVSGRIVDLGNRYLHEAAAMKLDRPALIPGNARHPAGYLPEIQEGRSYLLETTDGHFALVRVLEISKTSLTLQYVYQPSGTTTFEVPQGELIELKAGPATATEPPPPLPLPPPAIVETPPATAPAPALGVIGSAGPPGAIVIRVGGSVASGPVVLEPFMATHLRQRELLIQTRLKTVRAPAKTPAQIAKKVEAIEDLVSLHAEEAAEVLVEQIAFVNPHDEKPEFQDSVHPCFAALKRLGKPASNAAVKALRRLETANSPAIGLESAAYRAGLLALVVRAVEGDAVGEFILRRERDATSDQPRRALLDPLVAPEK